MPRQVGRPREIGAHLLIAHAQTGPHVVPYGFLPCDGERQVHTIQRHPVDEAFPVLPLPEGHCVAPRAVVQEEALRHPRCHPFGGAHIGQHPGQAHRHVGIPRYRHLAITVQVPVQRHRHRVGVIAADDDLASPTLEGKNILACVGLYLVKLHLARQCRRQPQRKCTGLLHIVVGMDGCAHCHQHGNDHQYVSFCLHVAH